MVLGTRRHAKISAWAAVVALVLATWRESCQCLAFAAASKQQLHGVAAHRQARPTRRHATTEALESLILEASVEEKAVVARAYEAWSEQFPIPAARRDFFGLPCGRGNVSARFLFLAQTLNFTVEETLSTFAPDLWILNQEPASLVEKVEVLRELASSQDEMNSFLRECPRSLGTTAAAEMKERGIMDMRARSALGATWEAINFPIRFVVQLLGAATARSIREGMDSTAEAETAPTEYLEELSRQKQDMFQGLTYVFFGTLFGLVAFVTYLDSAYGGPVHGKGLCVASVVPTYNLPDDEGNSRLPCNCAPLFRWYLEPLLSADQRTALLEARPKVESKNCGRQLGGAKKECDPRTVGGCVWTAEDLERDPSYWDNRALMYWELRRVNT